jgi:hypothetical protein
MKRRASVYFTGDGSFQLPPIANDQVSYKMSTEQIVFMLSGMSLEVGGYVKSDKYEPLLGAEA